MPQVQRWGISLIVGLLVVCQPLLVLAQTLEPFQSDGKMAIDRIAQLEVQATQRIRFLVMHEADANQATNSVGAVRAEAVRQITETVNNYKARYELPLAGVLNITADPRATAIRAAVSQVEYAGQQAVLKIETAISSVPKQSTAQLPRTGSVPFYRTELPSQQAASVLTQQPQNAPRLTEAYAKTGERPFIPLSPNIGGVLYRLQNPQIKEPKPDFWTAAGVAIGGYLGLRHLFNRPGKVRVSAYSPYDTLTYTVGITGDQEALKEVPVPTKGAAPIVQDLRAGQYRVFYKAQGSQQSLIHPLIINPGEVWCLQVPQPPIRCY